jgi:hypothetical protein
VRRGIVGHGLLLLLVLGIGGCGPKAPPAAGASTGAPPDLRGQQVMVFPAQTVRGGVVGVDEEVAFALGTRGSATRWILPEELREHLARSPAVQVRIDALPVGIFMRTEVTRVGDPLYGDLRRLAALTGADVALIPVEVRMGPGAAGEAAAVEIAAALLSARTGRVYWFGVVNGEPGLPGDPRAIASAADALAGRIAR